MTTDLTPVTANTSVEKVEEEDAPSRWTRAKAWTKDHQTAVTLGAAAVLAAVLVAGANALGSDPNSTDSSDNDNDGIIDVFENDTE